MVRLREAARPLVRLGLGGQDPADEVGPEAAHAAGRHVPVTHGDGAGVGRVAAHAADEVVPSGDRRVRRVDRHDAEARAALDRGGRLDEGHGEGAGVPIVPEAAAAGLLHNPPRAEGQRGGVPAVAGSARSIDLRPARREAEGPEGRRLARAVRELHGRDDVGLGLVGELHEPLADGALAIPAGAPGRHAALPMHVPEKCRHLHVLHGPVGGVRACRDRWRGGRLLPGHGALAQ
mmetsp:Transcript_105122/g.322272  ORF Transcript_105122/g.322272 Transcript_105122/m.322272 type:complete len:234 (+) Transcript_105122:293-994(+)